MKSGKKEKDIVIKNMSTVATPPPDYVTMYGNQSDEAYIKLSSGAEKEMLQGPQGIQGLQGAQGNLGIQGPQGSMIVGSMFDYAGSSPPTGWLMCNGDSISTTTYSDLFSAISYTYGGSGSSFSLPDFRGRVVAGSGTGAGLQARVLAASGGEENHALTLGELPMDAMSYVTNSGYIQEYSNSGSDITTEYNDHITQQRHNNMQPFLVLNKIIKY